LKKSFARFTRLFGLAFVLAAAGITVMQARQMPSEEEHFLPNGTVIAGVPVGGVDLTEARKRVAAAYDIPIELEYEGSRIQAQPHELGFNLLLDAMLDQAYHPVEMSWQDRLWAALWNEPPPEGSEVPLQFEIDSGRMRAYLENEIIPRYDRQPQAPFTTSETAYEPGRPGWKLGVEAALPLIEAALPERTHRSVTLPVTQLPAPGITLEQLQEVLIYNIERADLGLLVAFAMTDLQTGEELYFALQDGAFVDPEIAFTAASTIKIPIQLSVLKRTAEPTPEEVYQLLVRMSALSENPPADRLMERYIGEVRGPLMVTEDLRALGLENTFLAGYFYLGAPLLDRYTTPANSRTDINLRPDVYNQTTAGEMRDLMTWIYNCAKHDEGPIRETFRDSVSQSECQTILDVMAQNKTALLFEAGIPDGTRVSHKHGWVEEADGILRTMSDVGVMYTPGGDFAFSIFVFQPERLNFDATNILFARLSLAIYNAFNLEEQYVWMAYPRGGE
jgi:beta-lactamase class A